MSEAKLGDTWYRAEGAWIDDGSESYAGVEIDMQEWRIVRTTPCGAWFERVNYWHRKPKFGLTNGTARWISQTKEEALKGLIARKNRQLQIISHKQMVASDTLKIAHAMLDEMTCTVQT